MMSKQVSCSVHKFKCDSKVGYKDIPEASMNISTHISLFEATLLQVFLLRTSLTITTKTKAPWTNNVLGEKSELMQQKDSYE
jgi:hypothetical protein